MSRRPLIALAALSLCLAAGLAWAAEDGRLSGFAFMSRETQAMQKDDFANPGMLWVQDGAEAWKQKAGAANKSCADCHGPAEASMKGVAARYPAFDATTRKPIDLQGRINQCRETRQEAAPLPLEGHDLLALTTYVARQSRDLPISPATDTRLEPFRRQGETLYRAKMGQLNFSCADCHDANAGKHLAGAPIPQAHPTGYPLYRLEWQSLGSLQRRMRGCMTGVRAEPYPYGAAEYLAIELYLMSRARGMPMETPAVRP
jgi:sulfur-oxidizing protein SoxA